MAAMAERAMAEDRREKVLASVRAARERAEAQGDPLGIRRRPAAKEIRHASGQAAASVRKARDPLLRSSGTIQRLYTQKAIGKVEVAAAGMLGDLWTAAQGGALVRALDWRLERVDGGKRVLEPDMLVGALEAERRLYAVRVEIGGRAYATLRRIIVDGDSLTVIACDLEEDAGARSNGACSRRTLDFVSRQVRQALGDVAAVLGA
uniref:hypothetical protein n=1 Tax=Stappia sp. TaxID=1870903 RepID=UPI003BA9515C